MAFTLTRTKSNLWKAAIFFLLFVLIVVSCDVLNNTETTTNSNENTNSNVNDTEVSGNQSSESTVKFSLANTIPKGETSIVSPQPEKIFVLDIFKRDSADGGVTFHDFLPDKYGQVDLVMPKNGLYAIGFLGSDASKGISNAKGEKDIASSVTMIGNINIVSSGLSMLPVSANAQDVIDLGQLTEQNGEFSSALTVDQASTNLGIEEQELLKMGVYDEALRKFYNVDINSDGVIDWEQGLKWDFKCAYVIKSESTMPPLDYSYQTTKTIPSEMQIDNIGYIVDLIYEGSLSPELTMTEYPPLKVAELYALDKTLMIGTETIEYISGLTHQFGPGKFQTHFDNINSITSHKVPFGGDFELVHQGTKHNFKNIFFINRDSEYEGFIHPFYKLGVDSEGNILNIEWEFRIARNNVFIPMSEDEASYLFCGWPLVNIGYIDNLGTHRIFDANASYISRASGTIDLSQWAINVSKLTDIDIYCGDYAKNFYGIVFRKPRFY